MLISVSSRGIQVSSSPLTMISFPITPEVGTQEIHYYAFCWAGSLRSTLCVTVGSSQLPRLLVERYQVRLIVFDPEEEAIAKWLK